MTGHSALSTRPSQLPRGYKQTEVGVIPEDWEVTLFRDIIISMQLGGNYKNGDRTSNWPLIKMGNLGRGQICLDKLEYIDSACAPSIRDRLHEGDILFNTRNTLDLVGKVSIWRNELHEAYFNSNIMRIGFDSKRTSSRFMNYVLNTRHSITALYNMAIGTTSVAAIYSRDLINLPIPLPPTLAEQEAIAEALSDADALIESLEQLIAKKRLIKQGAMQELLTGKRRLPGFSGEWEVKRLGEVFEFSGGLSASRDQLSEDGYSYLHYGDIHTSTKQFVDIVSEYQNIPKLSIQLNKVPQAMLLCDGDVVFVDASEDEEGTSKHVVILNQEGIPFIAGLHTIVAKSKACLLETSYKQYCFQTRAVKEQFRFFAVGTKVSGVSKSNIVNLTIPIPSMAEQSAIASILSDMDAEIAALEERLEKARQIKQGMMQELLTGRVRVREKMEAV